MYRNIANISLFLIAKITFGYILNITIFTFCCLIKVQVLFHWFISFLLLTRLLMNRLKPGFHSPVRA